MERVVAMVMAGGSGERLQPLTEKRAKPAVPFAGKYRLIDFTLSNCINSGLRKIYVLTQYRSGSLARHIQDGWAISSAGLGDYIYCVPPQHKLSADWYRGTADAIRHNLDLVKEDQFDQVVVLSGDHVYKMDYGQMVTYHRRKKASITLSAVRTSRDEAAGKLGVLQVSRDYRLIGFEEKPSEPKTIPDSPNEVMASMGVYVFNSRVLKDILRSEGNDFGKELIPDLIARGVDIYVYDFQQRNVIEDIVFEFEDGRRHKVEIERSLDSSYWKDVGTIDSYYEASVELIGIAPVFNLYSEKWPIRTNEMPRPPAKCIYGARIQDSIICNGCIISGGTVIESILSRLVVVEMGAVIKSSVIFDGVIVEPNSSVQRAIVDKDVVIEARASIGWDRENDLARGCTVSESGVTVVPKGAVIKP
ncbi:MAG: glucose-1-phosphate adenylyltransferase [Chloroflexota bacterium]